MKNNLKIMLTVMFAAAMLTACGNVDEVVSERNVVSSASVSSTAASTTAESATTPIGTSETTTAAVTTSETVTTTPIVTKAAATTTTPAAAVTTTTTAKTTVTTPKPTTTVTTAKKPAAATTKKATTTVTTTKKTTTTTPKVTTTKKTTTTTAKKPAAATTTTAKLLTQEDIDRLLAEVQAYSDEIAYDSIYESVRNSRKYKDATEEQVLARVQEHFEAGWKKTPETSSWFTSNIGIKPTDDYNEALQECKEYLKGLYTPNFLHDFSDCHIVLYDRWCPNGEGFTNSFVKVSCWEIYFLR